MCTSMTFHKTDYFKVRDFCLFTLISLKMKRDGETLPTVCWARLTCPLRLQVAFPIQVRYIHWREKKRGEIISKLYLVIQIHELETFSINDTSVIPRTMVSAQPLGMLVAKANSTRLMSRSSMKKSSPSFTERKGRASWAPQPQIAWWTQRDKEAEGNDFCSMFVLYQTDWERHSHLHIAPAQSSVEVFHCQLPPLGMSHKLRAALCGSKTTHHQYHKYINNLHFNTFSHTSIAHI